MVEGVFVFTEQRFEQWCWAIMLRMELQNIYFFEAVLKFNYMTVPQMNTSAYL
jgi:hypothetical protein